MHARHRKSVYLNIRITRDMDKRIRKLTRERPDQTKADVVRDLFKHGLEYLENRGAVTTIDRDQPPRPIAPHPTPPASTPDVESEPKVAA